MKGAEPIPVIFGCLAVHQNTAQIQVGLNLHPGISAQVRNGKGHDGGVIELIADKSNQGAAFWKSTKFIEIQIF